MNKKWIICIHPSIGYFAENGSSTKDPNQALKFESKANAEWFASSGPGGSATLLSDAVLGR